MYLVFAVMDQLSLAPETGANNPDDAATVREADCQHTPVNDGYQPYGVFAIFTYGF